MPTTSPPPSRSRRPRRPVLAARRRHSLAGQCVTPGLVLDLSRHLGDRGVDPAARRARVQPGVVQDHLNRAAASTACSSGRTPRREPGHARRHDRQQLGRQPVDPLRDDGRRRCERLDVVLADGTRDAPGAGRRGRGVARRAAADTLDGRDPPRAARHRRRATRRARAGYPRYWRQAGGYRLDRIGRRRRRSIWRKVVVGSEGTLAIVVEAERRARAGAAAPRHGGRAIRVDRRGDRRHRRCDGAGRRRRSS